LFRGYQLRHCFNYIFFSIWPKEKIGHFKRSSHIWQTLFSWSRKKKFWSFFNNQVPIDVRWLHLFNARPQNVNFYFFLFSMKIFNFIRKILIDFSGEILRGYETYRTIISIFSKFVVRLGLGWCRRLCSIGRSKK